MYLCVWPKCWLKDWKIYVIREHSIFSVVLTEAVAPYYVEAWRRASVNTLEKIECSLIVYCSIYTRLILKGDFEKKKK